MALCHEYPPEFTSRICEYRWWNDPRPHRFPCRVGYKNKEAMDWCCGRNGGSSCPNIVCIIIKVRKTFSVCRNNFSDNVITYNNPAFFWLTGNLNLSSRPERRKSTRFDFITVIQDIALFHGRRKIISKKVQFQSGTRKYADVLFRCWFQGVHDSVDECDELGYYRSRTVARVRFVFVLSFAVNVFVRRLLSRILARPIPPSFRDFKFALQFY